MIYFHYCETYNKNTTPQIDKIVRRKLSEYSNRTNLKGIKSISSYTGSIFVLNINNPNHKIILEEFRPENIIDELQIYFVRDIFNMGQRHNWLYAFSDIKRGRWIEYNPLQQIEINKFISAYEQNQIINSQKDQPPFSLTKWHQDYKLKVDYDIYETESWVRFAMDNSSKNGMLNDEAKLYRLVLLEMVSNEKNVQLNILKIFRNVRFENLILNDIGIIYGKVNLIGHNKPIYILIFGANTKTQKSHWVDCLSIIEKTDIDICDIDRIQQFAIRAYPSWAFRNADLWVDIEKSSISGNLSLLPEQTKFLKEFTFPKYINGQAGCGKSTMLYYLFANAYYYKCAGEIEGEIIFLTENEQLLQHTKRTVIELLGCNPEFEVTNDDIANVESYFFSFKKFLLSLVINETDEFSINKYLDFSKFKILYEESHISTAIKNKYSPELVWFAITTYIFGYQLDYQITSDLYETEMPSEGKKILSFEVFRGIENFVVPFYIKLIEDEGYWDKIKIIKHIIYNNYNINKYEIIFCDETQDFSRVELRFILSLSQYIKYDLTKTKQVPIVFAGDSLQTVNPTGFRSAEVKDMLYQELKKIAGFDLDTNNIEYAPDFNYRSSQPIVNIANAIQYYRKKEFEAVVKKPQKAKRIEINKDSNINIFIDFDELKNNERLIDTLKYKTFIIPVNLNDKEAYIQRHPALKQFSDVKTAVEAKGIDYEQVVIFGFGEYSKAINNLGNFEKQFFYNKLYVAVTRAQLELVIIDSIDSETVFWKNLINLYADSDWALQSEIDLSVIRDTIVFGAGRLPVKSTPQKALENAIKDKKQGIIDKNLSLLRVAANQFYFLGNLEEASICLALVFEFRENWLEAAKFYLRKEIGSRGIDLAANCYWQGQYFEDIKNLRINTTEHHIRLIIIYLYENINIQKKDLIFLYENRIELRKLFQETIWQHSLFIHFYSFLRDLSDEDQIKILLDILEEIISKNDSKFWELIAQKHYFLKRYEKAIECFDLINNTDVYYIKSKLEVAKRKQEHNECINCLGILAFVEFDSETSYENEIIDIYISNYSKFDKETSKNVWLYIYMSFLIKRYDEKRILELAKITEKIFKINESDLVDNYFLLLKSKKLSSSIIDFVIDRWAKKSSKIGKSIDTINEDYNLISTINNIRNSPFKKSDIEEISEIPEITHKIPPIHFKTITIKNFRSFKDVRIENFGLFNLVVGDNNIGKTSFLEALLFTNNTQNYFIRLAFAYIERKNLIPEKTDNSELFKYYYKPDESFLNDYKNNNSDLFQIEFIIEEKRAIWQYKVQNEKHLNSLNTVNSNTETINFTKSDYEILSKLDYLDAIKQPFIPYGNGFANNLAQAYYAEISSIPKIEDRFIKDMRVFIPRIKRIRVDNKSGSIEILDDNFQDSYIPLHQYGEGANKLFRILIMLSLHRGKILLIDEIDSGIHYTRFKKFWEIILIIAKRDNTQIFATTHNEECIRYFTDVVSELGTDFQVDSRVVQLKNVNNNLKIRSYEFDSFDLAMKDSIEIRGGEDA